MQSEVQRMYFLLLIIIVINPLSMGKGYFSMTLTWEYTCKFIFPEWYSQSVATFILGCVITMLLAFLAMAMPKIRSKLEQILFSYDNTSSVGSNYHELQDVQNGQKDSIRLTTQELIVKKRIIPFFYALFYAILHVATMIIMMSMNGYVILSIIIGYTAGYGLLSDSCKLKKGKTCGGGCEAK